MFGFILGLAVGPRAALSRDERSRQTTLYSLALLLISRPGAHASEACMDLDDGRTDSASEPCSWYRTNAASDPCGNNDDDDFTSDVFCCACGGGGSCSSQDGAGSNSEDCDWYDGGNEASCGNFDDDDFTANTMCCAWGGEPVQGGVRGRHRLPR